MKWQDRSIESLECRQLLSSGPFGGHDGGHFDRMDRDSSRHAEHRESTPFSQRQQTIAADSLSDLRGDELRSRSDFRDEVAGSDGTFYSSHVEDESFRETRSGDAREREPERSWTASPQPNVTSSQSTSTRSAIAEPNHSHSEPRHTTTLGPRVVERPAVPVAAPKIVQAPVRPASVVERPVSAQGTVVVTATSRPIGQVAGHVEAPPPVIIQSQAGVSLGPPARVVVFVAPPFVPQVTVVAAPVVAIAPPVVQIAAPVVHVSAVAPVAEPTPHAPPTTPTRPADPPPADSGVRTSAGHSHESPALVRERTAGGIRGASARDGRGVRPTGAEADTETFAAPIDAPTATAPTLEAAAAPSAAELLARAAYVPVAADGAIAARAAAVVAEQSAAWVAWAGAGGSGHSDTASDLPGMTAATLASDAGAAVAAMSQRLLLAMGGGAAEGVASPDVAAGFGDFNGMRMMQPGVLLGLAPIWRIAETPAQAQPMEGWSWRHTAVASLVVTVAGYWYATQIAAWRRATARELADQRYRVLLEQGPRRCERTGRPVVIRRDA